MTQVLRRSFADARFRSNPMYDIVLLDQLDPDMRAPFAPLEEDPDLYGLLRPRSESLNIRSISREPALLFLTLRTPGPLPSYFLRLFGDRAEAIATGLVLDGILEIECDGRFVSGAAATAEVFNASPTENAPEGAIARLSLEALRYAEALNLDDPTKLSARLYFFNRAAVSPLWRRQIPSPQSVDSYLGIGSGRRLRSTLDRSFIESEARPGLQGWRLWTGRHLEKSTSLGFKLYLSPRTDHLPESFDVAIDLFAERQVPRFKFGSDLYGLLRPDKLVAYVESMDELMELGHKVLARLAGTPAQGVPFTSEIGGDGLLSWGMDPPREEQLAEWQMRPSWRLWLTNYLASALIAARVQIPDAKELWRFAIERVKLEGVDTVTWTPRQSIWSAVFEKERR